MGTGVMYESCNIPFTKGQVSDKHGLLPNNHLNLERRVFFVFVCFFNGALTLISGLVRIFVEFQYSIYKFSIFESLTHASSPTLQGPNPHPFLLLGAGPELNRQENT